jgi:tRNA-dihydrouridine synthase
LLSSRTFNLKKSSQEIPSTDVVSVGLPWIKILGNGDVKDIDHAKQLASETNCDGIMIGRAIFGPGLLI